MALGTRELASTQSEAGVTRVWNQESTRYEGDIEVLRSRFFQEV